jgi:hypothetical protein
MAPTDLAAGTDCGRSETDEALLQKMKQNQLVATGPLELQGNGRYGQ